MLVICEYAIAYAITYFAKTRISHIFLHIMAFSKSQMQKSYHICRTSKNKHIFAYMPHISAHAIAFFSIFLVQRCFKTVKYFWWLIIIGIYNYIKIPTMAELV